MSTGWGGYQKAIKRNAPTLRGYQLQAVEAVKARFHAGDRSTLLVQATGTGKTVVFANIAGRVVTQQRRALVLAHRTELLVQARQKLHDVGLACELEQGTSRAAHAPVVLASIQTLKGARLKAFDASDFSLVIIDEAHHAAAETYRAILRHFRKSRVLGVTATPVRADGVPLTDLFDSVAFRYDMLTAMQDGNLAPMRSQIRDMPEIDLSKVIMKGGDFDPASLAKLLNEERTLRAMAENIVADARGAKTMVFTVDVKNAYALATLLNQVKPRSAVAIDGNADSATRAHALAMFRAGKFQFLLNCALFTEGFDEPSMGCIIIARPTKSLGLHTQMMGRGARLHFDKLDCRIVDYTSAKTRTVTAPDSLIGYELDLKDRDTLTASPLYLHQAIAALAPTLNP